jgi:hypothetical protein
VGPETTFDAPRCCSQLGWEGSTPMWSSPSSREEKAGHDRPVLRGLVVDGGVVGAYAIVLYNNNSMVANHHPEKKSTPPKFFARQKITPLGPFSVSKKICTEFFYSARPLSRSKYSYETLRIFWSALYGILCLVATSYDFGLVGLARSLLSKARSQWFGCTIEF